VSGNKIGGVSRFLGLHEMTQDEIDKVLPSLYDSCTFKGLGRRFLISHHSRDKGDRIIIGTSEKGTLTTLRAVYEYRAYLEDVKIYFAQAVDFVPYPKTEFLTIARADYRHDKRAWSIPIKCEVSKIYKETGQLLKNFALCPEYKPQAEEDEEERKLYEGTHLDCINCNGGYGIVFDSSFDEDKLYISTQTLNEEPNFSDKPPTHVIENSYYGLRIYPYEEKEPLDEHDISSYSFPYASLNLRGYDFKESAELLIAELRAMAEVEELEHQQQKELKEVERKSKEREKFFTQLKLLGLA